MRRRGARGLVVVLVTATAACGGPAEPGAPATATPRPSSPSSSPADRPDPTLAPSARVPAQVRLSGVVRRSPEEAGVVLEARSGSGLPARTWVLVGAVGGLVDGAEATVVGRPDPDAVTTGQRGPVLVVDRVVQD